MKTKQTRFRNLWLLGLGIHILTFLFVLDLYFTSPIKHGMTPHKTLGKPLAKRIVVFIADGLRAEAIYTKPNWDRVQYLSDLRLNRSCTWGVVHTGVPTESRPGHVAIFGGLYEDPSAIMTGWQANAVEFDSVINQSNYAWSYGSPDIVKIFTKKDKVKLYIDSYDPDQEDFSGRTSTINLDTWVFNRVEELLTPKGNSCEAAFIRKRTQRRKLDQLQIDLERQRATCDAEMAACTDEYYECFKKVKPCIDAVSSKQTEVSLKQVDIEIETLDMYPACIHDFTASECEQLCKDGNIFFLHLLGMDTAGHVHKPDSKEYIENLRAVDKGIREMEFLFHEFFNDNGTAFLFTSDHGMTNWGSHGDGSEHETEVPYILWGKGVLPNANRQDLKQADLAPLIASLVGVPVPINSVGILPSKLLNGTYHQVAEAVYANVMQHIEQYKLLLNEFANDPLFEEYPVFKEPGYIDAAIVHMRELLAQGDPEKNVIKMGEELMKDILDANAYMRNFHFKPKLVTVMLGFLLWIVYLALSIHVRQETIGMQTMVTGQLHSRIWSPALMILSCFYLKGLEIKYFTYLYPLFPLGVLSLLCEDRAVISQLMIIAKMNHKTKFLFRTVVYAVLVQLLVFGFFNRLFCAVVIVILAVWLTQNQLPLAWKAIWLFITCTLAILQVFEPSTKFNYYGLAIGSVIWICIYFTFIITEGTKYVNYFDLKYKRTTRNVIVGPLLAYFVAACNALYVAYAFDSELGLSDINLIISWVITATVLLLIPIAPRGIFTRFGHIAACLIVPYALMAVNIDLIFYGVLVLTLYYWMQTEAVMHDPGLSLSYNHFTIRYVPQVHLTLSAQYRRTYFYLALTVCYFFAIGNMASFNGFDPQWTRAYVATFNPFLMAALIIIKMIIPFFLITCAFYAIVLSTRANYTTVFMILLLFLDQMVLNFMLFVRNEGSWKEIGKSLSHFAVMEAMALVMLVFFGIARYVCTFRIGDSDTGFDPKSDEPDESDTNIQGLIEEGYNDNKFDLNVDLDQDPRSDRPTERSSSQFRNLETMHSEIKKGWWNYMSRFIQNSPHKLKLSKPSREKSVRIRQRKRNIQLQLMSYAELYSHVHSETETKEGLNDEEMFERIVQRSDGTISTSNEQTPLFGQEEFEDTISSDVWLSAPNIDSIKVEEVSKKVQLPTHNILNEREPRQYPSPISIPKPVYNLGYYDIFPTVDVIQAKELRTIFEKPFYYHEGYLNIRGDFNKNDNNENIGMISVPSYDDIDVNFYYTQYSETNLTNVSNASSSKGKSDFQPTYCTRGKLKMLDLIDIANKSRTIRLRRSKSEPGIEIRSHLKKAASEANVTSLNDFIRNIQASATVSEVKEADHKEETQPLLSKQLEHFNLSKSVYSTVTGGFKVASKISINRTESYFSPAEVEPAGSRIFRGSRTTFNNPDVLKLTPGLNIEQSAFYFMNQTQKEVLVKKLLASQRKKTPAEEQLIKSYFKQTRKTVSADTDKVDYSTSNTSSSISSVRSTDESFEALHKDALRKQKLRRHQQRQKAKQLVKEAKQREEERIVQERLSRERAEAALRAEEEKKFAELMNRRKSSIALAESQSIFNFGQNNGQGQGIKVMETTQTEEVLRIDVEDDDNAKDQVRRVSKVDLTKPSNTEPKAIIALHKLALENPGLSKFLPYFETDYSSRDASLPTPQQAHRQITPMKVAGVSRKSPRLMDIIEEDESEEVKGERMQEGNYPFRQTRKMIPKSVGLSLPKKKHAHLEPDTSTDSDEEGEANKRRKRRKLKMPTIPTKSLNLDNSGAVHDASTGDSTMTSKTDPGGNQSTKPRTTLGTVSGSDRYDKNKCPRKRPTQTFFDNVDQMAQKLGDIEKCDLGHQKLAKIPIKIVPGLLADGGIVDKPQDAGIQMTDDSLLKASMAKSIKEEESPKTVRKLSTKSSPTLMRLHETSTLVTDAYASERRMSVSMKNVRFSTFQVSTHQHSLSSISAPMEPLEEPAMDSGDHASNQNLLNHFLELQIAGSHLTQLSSESIPQRMLQKSVPDDSDPSSLFSDLPDDNAKGTQKKLLEHKQAVTSLATRPTEATGAIPKAPSPRSRSSSGDSLTNGLPEFSDDPTKYLLKVESWLNRIDKPQGSIEFISDKDNETESTVTSDDLLEGELPSRPRDVCVFEDEVAIEVAKQLVEEQRQNVESNEEQLHNLDLGQAFHIVNYIFQCARNIKTKDSKESLIATEIVQKDSKASGTPTNYNSDVGVQKNEDIKESPLVVHQGSQYQVQMHNKLTSTIEVLAKGMSNIGIQHSFSDIATNTETTEIKCVDYSVQTSLQMVDKQIETEFVELPVCESIPVPAEIVKTQRHPSRNVQEVEDEAAMQIRERISQLVETSKHVLYIKKPFVDTGSKLISKPPLLPDELCNPSARRHQTQHQETFSMVKQPLVFVSPLDLATSDIGSPHSSQSLPTSDTTASTSNIFALPHGPGPSFTLPRPEPALMANLPSESIERLISAYARHEASKPYKPKYEETIESTHGVIDKSIPNPQPKVKSVPRTDFAELPEERYEMEPDLQTMPVTIKVKQQPVSNTRPFTIPQHAKLGPIPTPTKPPDNMDSVIRRVLKDRGGSERARRKSYPPECSYTRISSPSSDTSDSGRNNTNVRGALRHLASMIKRWKREGMTEEQICLEVERRKKSRRGSQ